MYTVYVLYSKKFDKLYIGYTSDLITRFRFHNQLARKGFTAKFRPWSVIHVEFFDSKSKAIRRETELKSAAARRWIRTTFLKNE